MPCGAVFVPGLKTLARLVLLGLFVIGDVDHLDIDLQGIARTKFRQLLGPHGGHLLGFELLQQVHGSGSGTGELSGRV